MSLENYCSPVGGPASPDPMLPLKGRLLRGCRADISECAGRTSRNVPDISQCAGRHAPQKVPDISQCAGQDSHILTMCRRYLAQCAGHLTMCRTSHFSLCAGQISHISICAGSLTISTSGMFTDLTSHILPGALRLL